MIRRMDSPGSHLSVCTFPSPQLYDDEENSGMICPSTLAVTNTLIVLQCTALQCTALYRIDWFPKKANYTLYFEYVHKCHLSCSIQNFKSTAHSAVHSCLLFYLFFSTLFWWAIYNYLSIAITALSHYQGVFLSYWYWQPPEIECTYCTYCFFSAVIIFEFMLDRLKFI